MHSAQRTIDNVFNHFTNHKTFVIFNLRVVFNFMGKEDCFQDILSILCGSFFVIRERWVAQQLPCELPLPVCCAAILILGFSKFGDYEFPACGCQGGDAGKGECGEDQPSGEIRSWSLLGRPIPERECQLLWFNSCVDPLLFPSSSLDEWHHSYF